MLFGADKSSSYYTVKIQTDNYTGQGIIYDCNGDDMYVATTAHVLEGLKQDDTCEVFLSEEIMREGKIIYISDSVDVAFVLFRKDKGINGRNFIGGKIPGTEPVKKDKKQFDMLLEGSTIFAYDYAGKKTMGNLISPWIYLEDFGLNMMLAKLPCNQGMSGAGVYHEKGFFVGIICGANTEETAILPFSVMESEWMLAKDKIDMK